MSLTAHDQLLDGIRAALLALPVLAGGNVLDDSDVASIGANVQQAIMLRLEQSQATQPYGGTTAPTQWASVVVVSAFVRNGARTDQGRPVFALANQVHQRLMANATLAAHMEAPLVDPLTLVQMRPDHELTDTRLAVVDLVYRCTHETAWSSLLPQA